MMKPYKTLLKHSLKERDFNSLLLITGNTYVENLNMLNFICSFSKVTIYFIFQKKNYANHMQIIEHFFWHLH